MYFSPNINLKPKLMINIPQRLLGEALLNSAKRHPEKTAIIFKNIEYSYSQLKKSAESLATFLVHSGLNRGDRVAIYMNNGWSSVVSIYAVTLAGGVFMVINPQTKAKKLQFVINDSEARFLITESRLKNEMHKAIDDTPTLTTIIVTGTLEGIISNNGYLVQSFESVLNDKESTFSGHKIIPNDLAALIYTSGSTGFPKGVMLTHQNMVFASWSLIEYLRLDQDERIMLVIPLAFDYGLYQLLMSVSIGGTLIVEQSFAFPANIYENIEKYKPTVFPGVPTVYSIMIAANQKSNLSFSCIEKITNTAAALPKEYIPGLKKLFPNALIFKMYGLTECKRVCYLEPELLDIKPKSVGKAIPGTEVFLLSPDGEKVEEGSPGILHVRGPHVMLGYWNNKKLSDKMLRPGNLPYEQILCTNDWFKIDDEGFLYFQSRNDDIIKTRGEKVSPIEVENAIYNVKEVKEAVVFGIPHEVMGEEIIAVVTSEGEEAFIEKKIMKECVSHLESFMIPSKVLLMEQMPKSHNGKIDKKRLKENILK